MPMIPAPAVSVLAQAHWRYSLCGFCCHTALATRINDSDCSMVITADGGFRGAKEIPPKAIVDEALEHCPSVQSFSGKKNSYSSKHAPAT